MTTKTYSIGEVVRLLSPDCDVSESSLRFWEKMGLIHSSRTPGGHRVYTEDDLARIRIIKQLQTRRYMPLEEIRKLCQSGMSTSELAAIAAFKDSFFRPLRYDPDFQPLSREDLAARTGLSPETLVALESAGALRSQPHEAGSRYDEDALRIAEIFTELSRFGVEPEDFREVSAMTQQLVELQYRYYLSKLYPNLPPGQEASHVQVLADLGQELIRILYHQTYLSVATRFTREGHFDQALAKKTQKAKTP